MPTAPRAGGPRRQLRRAQRAVQQPLPGVGDDQPPAAVPPRAGRAVLGRAAGRPGGRARHPPARLDPGRHPAALGHGQARPGRRRRAHGRGRVRPARRVVDHAPHRRHRLPLHLAVLRPAGPGAGRLRLVRLRPRRARRHRHPQGPGGHGRHPWRGPGHPGGHRPPGAAPVPPPAAPHLPGRQRLPDRAQPLAGDWVVTRAVCSAQGTKLTPGSGSQALCDQTAAAQCLAKYGAGAYNQGIETALFVLLAVAPLLVTVRLVRRRIA